MRALSLLLFTLLAVPAAAQVSQAPSGCKEDNTDCREDCTVEYGSSSRTYDKLGACMQQCKQKYDKCRERSITLQKQKKPETEAPSSSPKTPTEKGKAASTEASEEKPASTPEPQDDSAEPPVRRGVYRAAEKNPEPEAAPKPAPEAAPKPAPKPAPEAAPKPAPEPTKAEEPKKSEPAAKSQASKTEEPKKPEPKKPEPETTAADDPEPLIDVYGDPPPKPKSKPRSKSAPARSKPSPEPK